MRCVSSSSLSNAISITSLRWKNLLIHRKTTGKLAQCSDANAGSRALCPNFRPNLSQVKVRTNFHVFGCFMIIYHFIKQKKHDGFPSVVSKLPLQKGDEPSGSSFVQPLNPKSDHWNGFVRTFTQFTSCINRLVNWVNIRTNQAQ